MRVQGVEFKLEEHTLYDDWCDDSVRTLLQLRQQARTIGRKVQIAELLTVCEVKHYELNPAHHKYKGRIVFRGDLVRDATGAPVFFDTDSHWTYRPRHCPALRPEHCTSCSDAIQAYLQAPVGQETRVIIPFELVLSSVTGCRTHGVDYERFPVQSAL